MVTGLIAAQELPPALQAPAKMRPVGAKLQLPDRPNRILLFESVVIRPMGSLAWRISFGRFSRQAKNVGDAESPRNPKARARRSQRSDRRSFSISVAFDGFSIKNSTRPACGDSTRGSGCSVVFRKSE